MQRWTSRDESGRYHLRKVAGGIPTVKMLTQRLGRYEDLGIDPDEIVPDKHGKWLPQILLGQRVWDCSECKTLGSPHWKRCPVCEAKMDLQDVTDINVGNKPVTNRNGLERGGFQNGNSHDAAKNWPPYLDLPKRQESLAEKQATSDLYDEDGGDIYE